MLITCKNIRYIRERAGLSQEEFGKPFKLNRGNISSYEDGSLPKDPSILVKIANYFGVDLQTFLTKDLSNSDVKIEVPKKIYLEDRVDELQKLMDLVLSKVKINDPDEADQVFNKMGESARKKVRG